jgi:hypothetical protein
MWTWAAEQDVDWCLFLQDDAIVAPDFWARLDVICGGAMGALPIIGLQAPHPVAPLLAEEGYGGFTTADGLVGVGYVVERHTLRSFLEWRKYNEDQLSGGMADKWPITEDTMLGLYAAATGLNVYHPIPTIVDHDTSIPSVYGNDAHPDRQSACRWDSPSLDTAPHRDGVPHLGRFYNATPRLLATFTTTAPQWVAEVTADDGHYEQRRARHAQMGRRHEPDARVVIATPTRGGMTPEYCQSVFALLRQEAIDIAGNIEIVRGITITQDVCRVRNRIVDMFLATRGASHLLFVDDDVEFIPAAVLGMLATKEKFVACPYPQRGAIDWRRIEDAAKDPKREVLLEALATNYHFRTIGDVPVEPEMVNAAGAVEVASVPLGLALLEREELQRVSDACESRYLDRLADGTRREVANMFGLAIDAEEGGLMSEDYSFCKRWRKYGGKVHMYLGAGSPVTHHGSMAFRGIIEALGLRRGVSHG